MNGLQPIQTLPQLLAECPFSSLEDCAKHIYPLIGRLTNNWKTILMDCGAIVSISCFAVTFLIGPSLYCSAFFIVSIASIVGSFYMRQFALEEQNRERIETAARSLRNENERLTTSNQEYAQNNQVLTQTSATFRQNNQVLAQTNAQLQTQVVQLNLQVTQLKESSEKICSEVRHFGQQNSHLGAHVHGFDESLRVLDQQIANSKALCEQISTHLSTQQQGLGQQLEQLGRYLADLRADNRVHERIQELGTLQQQMIQATTRLNEIQIQYATERANFQTIREALVQLRDQFDQAIRNAANNFQANNQQLSSNVAALAAERQRIHDLLSRHFPLSAS